MHADNPQYIQAAEMMREWAKEAGIDLKVEPVSEVGALLDAGTYDILTTGWSVNPDPDYILGINRCSGLPAKAGGPYLSDAYYCNPEYDKAYAAQAAEARPAQARRDRQADAGDALQGQHLRRPGLCRPGSRPSAPTSSPR